MDPQPDPRTTVRRRLGRLLDEGRSEGDRSSSLLDQLCRLSVGELAVDGATVTLLSATGSGVVVGASHEAARAWETLQFDLGEGPTDVAARVSRPVLVGDLAAAAVRWPGFVSEALAAGLEAVFALPIRLGASVLGVITLYRSERGRLSPTELLTALVLADMGLEMLIDGSLTDGPGRATVLDGELDVQMQVYQAQGMVMVQLGVDLVEALGRMRARAYAQGQTLAALSADIVGGSTYFSKDD